MTSVTREPFLPRRRVLQPASSWIGLGIPRQRWLCAISTSRKAAKRRLPVGYHSLRQMEISALEGGCVLTQFLTPATGASTSARSMVRRTSASGGECMQRTVAARMSNCAVSIQRASASRCCGSCTCDAAPIDASESHFKRALDARSRPTALALSASATLPAGVDLWRYQSATGFCQCALPVYRQRKRRTYGSQ